jgi:hypothetical protein
MAQNEQDGAEEKARQVMRSVLPDGMWSTFEKTGSIEFTGKRATYVISPWRQTEIRDAVTGRYMGQACMQLSIAAPAPDRMIAEYLLLKNAEDFYWQTANVLCHSYAGLLEFLLGLLDFVLLFHLLMSV